MFIIIPFQRTGNVLGGLTTVGMPKRKKNEIKGRREETISEILKKERILAQTLSTRCYLTSFGRRWLRISQPMPWINGIFIV